MNIIKLDGKELLEITLEGSVIATEGDKVVVTLELDNEDIERMAEDRDNFLKDAAKLALKTQPAGWYYVTRIEWVMVLQSEIARWRAVLAEQ